MSFIALQTCYLQLKTINFIARLNTPRFPYIFSNKHCDFVGLITPNLIVNFFEKAAPLLIGRLYLLVRVYRCLLAFFEWLQV